MDALGNLVRFLLLGQAPDMKCVAPLIKGLSFDTPLGNTAFHADFFFRPRLVRCNRHDPAKNNRKIQREYKFELYQ